MPIYRPDGPGVATKGSANTQCMCVIHTHDRGKSNPSQPIDLSPYITAASVSAHISGGSSAQVNLPAVDYIIDIIAAGDVINIYFNTHRSNENIYNMGNVRTFFGYVDSVTESVSVGSDGKKLTTYTINCKDFSKSIRQTLIYHNEHLASQTLGSTQNVVRKDVRSNLGGIAMLHQGISLQGTPRKIVLQNLMRFLGFGGQWALPTSYSEFLPTTALGLATGAASGSWNLDISVSNSEDSIQSVHGILEKAKADKDQEVLEKLAQVINVMVAEGGHAAKGISPAWDSVTVDGSGTPVGVSVAMAAEIKALKSRYKQASFKSSVIPTVKKEGFINNTFFTVCGANSSQYTNSMAAIVTDEKQRVKKDEQRLIDDLKLALSDVISEIGAIDSDLVKELNATPKANQYAEPLSSPLHKTPVRTIFNILCLDYMEEVKGFWAKTSMLEFQGDLYTALQDGANHTMNELFFDLRPSPLFTATEKDGLGIPLGGALPMVPAVVLRLKPFTNYPLPQDNFVGDAASMVMGAFPDVAMSASGTEAPGGPLPLMMQDQLVVNTGGKLGRSGPLQVLESAGELKNKWGGQFDKLAQGTGLGEIKEAETVTPVKGKRIRILADGVPTYTPDDIEKIYQNNVKAMYTGQVWTPDDPNNYGGSGEWSEDAPNPKVKGDSSLHDSVPLVAMVKLALGGAGMADAEYYAQAGDVPLARQATHEFITLPRPIFRSPDNNRITKELDMSQTQYLLGFMKDDGANDAGFFGMDFFAFAAKSYAGGAVFDIAEGVASGGSITESLIEEGTSALDFTSRANEAADAQNPEDINWHVLDYMTIDSIDIRNENYTRGDFEVTNVMEYWGAALGGVDHQRYFLGTVMPLVTPLSIYRFGIRPWTGSTEFIQAILTGGISHNHQRNVLLRWVILQDMWQQHNHELLGGTMILRGMPGIRVGYRLDLPHRNLSVYVDQVSHGWSYPGELSTSIGFSRGQPMGADHALPYAPPISGVDPEDTERQKLGKVFKTSEWTQLGKTTRLDIPGTFTGPKGVGRQIELSTRKSPPKGPAGPLGDIVEKASDVIKKVIS